MIICWLYVKNCIFEHMTDKIFPVTGPLQKPISPKVEMPEPPIVIAGH